MQQDKKEKSFFVKLLKVILFAAVIAAIIKAFVFDAYKIPTGSMENTLLIGDFIVVNKLAYTITTPRNIPFTDVYIKPYRILKYSKPEINDIIVFEYPGNKNELYPQERTNYIKRVAAGPGDTLRIDNKDVYVNGRIISPPPSVKIDHSVRRKNSGNYPMFHSYEKWSPDFYGPLVVPSRGSLIQLDYKNIEAWGMIINREYGKKVVDVEGTVVTINGKPVKDYIFRKDYYFVLGDNRDDSMDSRYWGFVPEDYVIGEALMIYWSMSQSDDSSDLYHFFNSIRLERIFSIIE